MSEETKEIPIQTTKTKDIDLSAGIPRSVAHEM